MVSSDTKMELLARFNKKYNESCTIYGGSYNSDMDTLRLNFYTLGRIDVCKGKVSLVCKGRYEMPYDSVGEESHSYEMFGFKHSNNQEETRVMFPVSQSQVAHSIGTGEFMNTQVKAYDVCVSLSPLFSRYWANSVDVLASEYPKECHNILSVVTHHIDTLTNKAKAKGYKNGWVYHAFQKESDGLDELINSHVLKNTKYYFPSIFIFNAYQGDVFYDNSIRQKIKELESLLFTPAA